MVVASLELRLPPGRDEQPKGEAAAVCAAARVGDPIAHTSALEGLLLGLAVGAAAVVVAAAAGVTIVASGGLAAVVAVGAVM